VPASLQSVCLPSTVPAASRAGGFFFSLLVAAAALLAAPGTGRADTEVDVELVLAVDISQSMDEEEQRVQRQGYVSAMLSKEVADAIATGANGKVAVTYVEWGGVGEQFVVADWQLIDGPESAESFAGRLAAAPLRTVQRTSIAGALNFAADLFDGNGYRGVRQVIDISGDGPNNQGGLVTASRDSVLQRGIIINGLPLMMKSGGSWYYLPNLDQYYEDCVIGGPGAFTVPVKSLEGFADAIRKKLVLEVAGRLPQKPLVIPAAARQRVACNMYD
jgi:hypothetical protein